MTNPPHVAVLILTYNDTEMTKQCVKSILASGYSNFTVYLVDNGSNFDCISPITNIYPEINYIKILENHGFSGGFNSSIKYLFENQVSFEYIWMISNDLTVENSALELQVEIMKKQNNIGFMGPETFKRGGEGEHDQWITVLKNDENPADIKLLNEKDVRDQDFVEVEFVVGHCLLVRKEVILDVGLMRDFFIYWEEREWQWRAKKRGWKMFVVPGSICYHDRDSFNKPFNTYFRARNFMFFNRILLKYDGNFRIFLMKNITHEIKWAILMTVKKKWSYSNVIPFFKGFLHGLYKPVPNYDKVA